jgi:hypothetical protein
MMMRITLTFLFTIFLLNMQAQKLSGQWTGGFGSTTDIFGGRTEYVLELDVKGKDVSGFSYTYFNIAGKRCYVICRLVGSYEKESKSVIVTEVEKVKSNTPPEFRDLFQTHELTYFKSGETESLKGKWKPARIKDGNETGNTELERKALVKIEPNKSPPPVAQKTTAPKTNTQQGTKTNSTKPGTTASKSPSANSTVSGAPKKTSNSTKPPAAKTERQVAQNPEQNNQKTAVIDNNLPNTEKPKAPSTISNPGFSKIEKRNKQVIKVIEVESKTFRVDMYDNGQIDGDTISLFFNGKLMVSRQRLTTDPIRLNLTIDTERENNELVMYADNLGSIPPNTALMVVTVGDKRYEVNISSSEQTNGTVRFKLKE